MAATNDDGSLAYARCYLKRLASKERQLNYSVQYVADKQSRPAQLVIRLGERFWVTTPRDRTRVKRKVMAEVKGWLDDCG